MLMPFPIGKKTIRSGETAHSVISVEAGKMSMVVTQRKGLCIAVNIKTEIVSIPTITRGNSSARQHKCFICAACWRRNKVKAQHPSASPDCPHYEHWLASASHEYHGSDGLGFCKANKQALDNQVKLHEEIRQTGVPNCEGARISLETKVSIEFLESQLKDYDDISVIKYCKHGWPINIVETEFNNRITPKNHKSALNFLDEMNKYITEELDHGSVLGSFECNSFSNPAIISPLSTCEKRGSDERRVIMDLRFPPGNSVNERIPKDRYNGEGFSLTFPSIDALVYMVKIKGSVPWISCQIRKIAGCACAGNARNVLPATAGWRSRHASRHVRYAHAVLHAGIAN